MCCGIGSWEASVRVWGIMSRGWGPRGGRAVPEGVHVDFLNFITTPDSHMCGYILAGTTMGVNRSAPSP